MDIVEVKLPILSNFFIFTSIYTPLDLSESVTIVKAWAERAKYLYQRVEFKAQNGSEGTEWFSQSMICITSDCAFMLWQWSALMDLG